MSKHDVMSIAFFSRKVVDKFVELGYLRSKKGNLYKRYYNLKSEIIAIPKCLEMEGKKALDWYIISADDSRPMLLEEAVCISEELAKDIQKIKRAMK
jgi:predicted ATPase